MEQRYHYHSFSQKIVVNIILTFKEPFPESTSLAVKNNNPPFSIFQPGIVVKNMNDIGINKFLGPLGLLQYAEIFQIKGYDVESDFCSLNTGDLDAMNITHAGHRETILQAG